MTVHKNRLTTMCLTALLASFGSSAKASEFYLGGKVGQELDGRVFSTVFFSDSERDAFKRHRSIYAGYRFLSHWAVEAAYHDFGDLRYHFERISDAGTDIETDGWSVGIRSTLPVDWRIKPYAKLGYYEFTDSGTEVWFGGIRDYERRQDGLMAEVGALIDIHQRFALRLTYEHYDFDSFTGDNAGWALGGEFRF